jgi:hypothetical protein
MPEISVDFEKFIPSLHQFYSYYHIMKKLGLIEDVKIEIDDLEGPTITVNTNLTTEAKKIFA